VELEAIAAGGVDPESLGFDPNALARILYPAKADATGPEHSCPGRRSPRSGAVRRDPIRSDLPCEDEADEVRAQRVHDELAAAGHQFRVVCT